MAEEVVILKKNKGIADLLAQISIMTRVTTETCTFGKRNTYPLIWWMIHYTESRWNGFMKQCLSLVQPEDTSLKQESPIEVSGHLLHRMSETITICCSSKLPILFFNINFCVAYSVANSKQLHGIDIHLYSKDQMRTKISHSLISPPRELPCKDF